MEIANKPYVTSNLTELPSTLIIDLTDELKPIRNLIVEFYPYFTERDFNHIVKKLIYSISYSNQADFEMANFAVDAVRDFFEPLNVCSSIKLYELEETLIVVCRNVFMKMQNMSAYINGVFPYKCTHVLLGSELVLKNTAYMNYMLELEQKPYSFNI